MYVGFFSLNNGVINNHHKILGNATITAPTNTTIKMDFGTNWLTCALWSIFA